jgi:IclR family acetate operon transcriptional repressor
MGGTLTIHRRDDPVADGTQSAERVAEVLLAVGDGHPDARVSEIARRLHLSKSVVHRILRSLARKGLVAPGAGGTYRLGAAAAGLGATALRELDLRGAAMPVLRSLRAATGETATLSALLDGGRVYLDQLVSAQQIRMEVELGRRFPLHAGASSKAILAVAPADLRERVLAGELERLTPKTIVDAARLRRELRRVARDGVAVSRGERQPGAGSVAAAVLGPLGDVLGSISVCGPASRFDDATCARLAPLVRCAAADIEAALRRGARR